jgi:hypothetical protein
MKHMTARPILVAIVLIAAVACSSVPSPKHAGVSPSASTGGYLGSLGSSGCNPAAAFHEWQPPHGGFPEAGLDNSKGSFWALLFNRVPPPAGMEIKVVWRMTGSGEFIFRISDANGKPIPLVWGPDMHGGSNWNHPGDEVGTGINFPHGGCWNVHVTRANVSADLWVEVTS